jgi:hypothetical protein
VYLNWFTSRKYRISLVYSLCDRKWKICQNQQDRDLELKKLKQILAKNENSSKKSEQQIPQAQQATVEKPKKYIVLPYTNKVDAFADRLTKVVNETFDVELKVAFKAPNEIGKLFPFKDSIKETHVHSIVEYKITCDTCNQDYIEKTKRILIHRIKEHFNEAKELAIQTYRKEFPTHTINPPKLSRRHKLQGRTKRSTSTKKSQN